MKCLTCIYFIALVLGISGSEIDNNSYSLTPEEQDLFGNGSLIHLHPDTGLNISQFLSKYNYPLEIHTVTTEDGYILTLHRIPYGRNENATNTSKPVVFHMHGILCSSMDWIMKGPDEALGLLLADAGYDVWLGNNRGNTHSRKHVTLDPDNDTSFWDYSFHEMGFYDDPAMIDYILNKTGVSNLTYVGHSQGTTQFFALASTKPEYNDKINLMVALSPVVYLKNQTNPIVKVWAENDVLANAAIAALNIHEVFPHTKGLTDIANLICNDQSGLQIFCEGILYAIAGSDKPQMNTTFITVITTSTPAGSSIKQFQHYIQEVKSGLFSQYDYGFVENARRYDSFTPPVYNTSLITAPVAAYYAQNDLLLSVSGAKKIIAELPNVVKDHLVDFESFNHIDFIYAKDVKTLVNDDVVQLINEKHGY